MEWVNNIRKIFQPPSAEVLMVRQLEDAKRNLLAAHSYREDAESMVAKYTERVARLEANVKAIVG